MARYENLDAYKHKGTWWEPLTVPVATRKELDTYAKDQKRWHQDYDIREVVVKGKPGETYYQIAIRKEEWDRIERIYKDMTNNKTNRDRAKK